MLDHLLHAEECLNSLLPVSRLQSSPDVAMLHAAQTWSNIVWLIAQQTESIVLSEEEIKKANKLVQHPVFICGVHRSGTTLTRDLLDGHPDLVVLPSEGTYYTNLEKKLKGHTEEQQVFILVTEWLRRLANPINQPPYWLLGRTTENNSAYLQFVKYFIVWWKTVDRKNRQWRHLCVILAYASCTNNLSGKLWVDKTPLNEFFLRRIGEEMREAKIIHVVREPVAVLSSRKIMEPALVLSKAVHDLKKSFRIAVKQLEKNNSNYLLLHYEEICENTKSAIEKILSFLHLEQAQSVYQPTVNNMPTQANSSFIANTKAGEILKSTKKNEPVLSKKDFQLLNARLGSLPEKLGYTTSGINLF